MENERDARTPLVEVVEEARGLLLRNRSITAVHIVDGRKIDAFGRWELEMLVDPYDLQLTTPREGSLTLRRAEEPEANPEPRRVPIYEAAKRKLDGIGRWSAGFEGLTEGVR